MSLSVRRVQLEWLPTVTGVTACGWHVNLRAIMSRQKRWFDSPFDSRRTCNSNIDLLSPLTTSFNSNRTLYSVRPQSIPHCMPYLIVYRPFGINQLSRSIVQHMCPHRISNYLHHLRRTHRKHRNERNKNEKINWNFFFVFTILVSAIESEWKLVVHFVESSDYFDNVSFSPIDRDNNQ